MNCDPGELNAELPGFGCEGSVRYTVLLIPAYAIVAGYAFSKVQAIFKREILKDIFLVIIFILIFWTAKLDIPRTFFFDSRPARYADLIAATNRTPEDCVILGLGPELARSDLIKNNKRMTTDILLVQDGDIIIQKAYRGNCTIYFDWGPNYPDSIADKGEAILNKYFKQEFLFSEGEITAYLLKPKNKNN